MQPQRSSLRVGAVISLMGVALAMPGFFFPLLTGLGYDTFTSSEWLLILSRWAILTYPAPDVLPLGSIIVYGFLALIPTLPLLSALVVLCTSISACFKNPSFRLLVLRRIGAIAGLSIQSLISIVILSYRPDNAFIGPGFVLLLLGFSLTVVGAFLSRLPRPTSQEEPVAPESQSSRIVGLLSIVGVAMIIVGLFLPMLSEIGNPPAVSEWNLLVSNGNRLTALLLLPLFGAVIVVGTTVAAMFRKLSPGFFIMRRIVAVGSFFLQLLLGGYAYLLYTWVYGSKPIGAGVGIPLTGFALLVIVAFFPRIIQAKLQEESLLQSTKPE